LVVHGARNRRLRTLLGACARCDLWPRARHHGDQRLATVRPHGSPPRKQGV